MMEGDRKALRGQSACLNPPQRRVDSPPWPPRSGLLSSILLSPLFPFPLPPPSVPSSPLPPLLLLFTPSFSQRNPAPCSLLTHFSGLTCAGHDGSSSPAALVLPWHQRDPGVSGNYKQDGEGVPSREWWMPGVRVRLSQGSGLQSVEVGER